MHENSNDNNDELEIVDLDYEPEELNSAQVEEKPKQQSTVEADQESDIILEEDDPASDHVRELEDSLKKKEEEIKKLQDRLLRQQADFENFRKRTQKEIKQVQEMASEEIIKDLLPLFDNIERGLEAGRGLKEKNPHMEGLQLIHDQFWKILTDQGIEKIQALNSKFDTRYHFAVNAIESADHPNDMVIDEYQPGFMLKSKVIRPSMVVVSKKPKEEKSKNIKGKSTNKENLDDVPSESELN